MRLLYNALILLAISVCYVIVYGDEEVFAHRHNGKTNDGTLYSLETTTEIISNVEKRTTDFQKEAKPAAKALLLKLNRDEQTKRPVAVPVATPEEAEKANEFAIFLLTAETTVVYGEILERSELPNPKKSDYPNCRFTVHFYGNNIKSGKSCPRECSLIVEGFQDYCILDNNAVKSGDKVLCEIVPFEQLPEDFQSTQLADDLELFLLESYYVISIKTIKAFSDDELMPVSRILFSDKNDEYISIFDRHINPPIEENITKAQAEAIKKDLDKMNHLLEGYNEDKIKEINKFFTEAWDKEKANDPQNYNRVKKENVTYVWRNIDNSFWALPVSYSLLKKPDELNTQTLECFSSLKRILEANGVQFIVSIVPDSYVVSSRVINKNFRDIPDIQTATYVKQLSEIGVETIYSSDSIIKNYNLFPFAFFYPFNSHPADTTQDVISDILIERLNRYEINKELNSEFFSINNSSFEYKGKNDFIFPFHCDNGDNQEGMSYTYSFRQFLYDGKEITRSKQSPVIVIGNSFIEYPVSPPEALPVLLTYKLCSPVDWYRISGYGPFSDILIQLLSNPKTFLDNKKVLIMQFGIGLLTEINRSGRMLDIAKLDRRRVLLNNKETRAFFPLKSNVDIDQIVDSTLWGPLSSTEKTVLKIDETGEWIYSLNLESVEKDINNSEPIVCVIPHTCVYNTSCKITVNGMAELMHSPSYANNSRFFNLAYELPAGTKEITIKIEGKPDTLIAIKDIQIWQ